MLPFKEVNARWLSNGEVPSENTGQHLSISGTHQATTPPNPYGAATHRTQMDPVEYGPSLAPRALTDIFDLSAQPY